MVGETDKDGYGVISKSYNERNLFATIFSALGLDPHKQYDLPDLPTFHYVEKKSAPIHEILA